MKTRFALVTLLLAIGLIPACSDDSTTGAASGAAGTAGAAASATGGSNPGGASGNESGSAGSSMDVIGGSAGASASSAGGNGTGGASAGNGASGAAGTENGCGNKLQGVVRDFKIAHPDFEDYNGDDPGIVEDDLGSDRKPVYAGQDGNPSTSGKANFDQWYRDTPGVNIHIPISLEFTPGDDGILTYDNQEFFPIDDQGWGDEGNPHNFHFTFELHTSFKYSGGEHFHFRGDDDVWTFINNKLVVDLGGVHSAEESTVDLDAVANDIGITPGGVYTLDFFFAERHTSKSTFRIDTTLAFENCGEIIQ